MKHADRAWTPTFMLLTCEHGGNSVPIEHAELFSNAGPLLDSHRGWDPGALDVAQHMARALHAPLIASTTSRLLVDLNRSEHNPQLFSELCASLTPDQRETVLDTYYRPHRVAVFDVVAALIAAGHRVLHIGVHSFTDSLDGAVRDFDHALLFDPDRASEHDLCARWLDELSEHVPESRLRANEPYKGTDDGLTTSLRREHPAPSYAGVEIEMRQGAVTSDQACRQAAAMYVGTLLTLLPWRIRAPR